LYQFADSLTNEPVTIKINGQPVTIQLDRGYALLDRTWRKGDVVELELPMPVRRVTADPQVTADIGRVALERGPMVFCAEWPDNPGGKVRDLIVPDDQPFTASFEPELLNGVETIQGRALRVSRGADGAMLKTEQSFKAIPYFAWANRGKGEMMRSKRKYAQECNCLGSRS
jgi:DUF1680 family protein